MSKKVFLPIALLIFLFSCKQVKKVQVLKKIKKPGTVYVTSEFSKEIKINGKLIKVPGIGDTTSDLTAAGMADQTSDSKPRKSKKTKRFRKKIFDSTTDLAAGDATSDTEIQYITDPDKIAFYRNYERIFNEYIADNLALQVTDNKLDMEVFKLEEETVKDDVFYVEITVDHYDEGEYNLIKNIDTRMILSIHFYSGPEKVASIHKSYTIKTGIGYPLERQRLNLLSLDVIHDVMGMFSSKLFLREKIKK